MFVKPIIINNKKTGKRYTYYRLCESYRIGDAPRHRNILNLGTLEELPDRRDHKLLADRIEAFVFKRTSLFDDTTPAPIRKLAHYFGQIIIDKKLLDVPASISRKHKSIEEPPDVPDFQEIDINSIGHDFVREVGAEWLCKQTLERLGIEDLLRSFTWDEWWVKVGMLYLTARTVFPASDLKTEDWMRRNSALAELYGLDAQKITRHHFYEASRKLYSKKEQIEKFLSNRTGELFVPKDKILLYDLTNTYFEGGKMSSKKARFGRSKEKRSDAKLISMALVVNGEGFVKYSRFYPGNMQDHQTLTQTLTDIESNLRESKTKRVVVTDAGIGTEENLHLLRKKQYDYVCVARSMLKDYEAELAHEKQVLLRDKRGNEIAVQWLSDNGTDERILYVRSAGKQLKEQSMDDLFCQRFEEGLEAIKAGIKKKGGVKKRDKVYERLGRLKEKYRSVHRYYSIKITSKKGTVKKLEWKKFGHGGQKHGVYFIRTTLKGKDEKTVWNIYNTIREVESTFRTLKRDLEMRPVHHQKDIYTEPHLWSSVVAYTIVHSIRYPLKAYNIHYDWQNIVRIMNTQKVITSRMTTRTGGTIYMKKCSNPEADVSTIYRALGYRDRPFWQKKSVLPKNEKPDLESLDSG